MRWRRERPPAEITAKLEDDERVLTWGRTDAGAAIVATQRGLWLPDAAEHRRVGWHEIDKATWNEGELTVTEGRIAPDAPEFVEDQPPAVWQLTEPGELPKVVRARVNRSVAVTEHHLLRPAGGVRIVGRRVSGRDGLFWLARVDPGTDRHAPEVIAQIDALLAEARQRFAEPAEQI